MPSAATKKARQGKNRQKAETAAIIAAAGAGTVAATGASGKAVLDAADKGGQVATKTAGAMAVGATAATAVQIGTLMAALVAARGGMRWLSDMVKPDGKMSAEDIQQALKAEAAREEAFVEAMRERLERDMPEALAQVDPDAAVEALLEREQRYLEAHEDAAAIRVQEAARRAQVKRLSPEGAYWVLSPVVKKHTPDCVALAAVGWWPWEVLDDLNPPVHAGCACSLLGHEEAIRDGLLPPGKPPSTHRAIERAEEIKKAHDLHEASNQDYSDSAMVALYPDPELAVELALPGGETTDRLHMTLGSLGKIADLGSLDEAVAAVRDWARKCPPLVGEVSGYGVFVAGPEPVTYASVDIPDLPAARQGLVDTLEATGSPVKCDHGFTPHITLAYESRRPKVEARPVTFSKVHLVWGDDSYVFALGAESDLQENRDLMELQWNRRYAKGTIYGGRFMPRRGGFSPRLSLRDILRKVMGNDAPDVVSRGQQRTISAPDPTALPGMRSAADKGQEAVGKAKAAVKKAADTTGKKGAGGKLPPSSAAAVFDRALARQVELARKYGAEVTPLLPESRPGASKVAQEYGGVRYEVNGAALIEIGSALQDALNEADEIRAAGGQLSGDQIAGAYDARRTINHELTHNTSAIRQSEYSNNPEAFALEEAMTEYLAHARTVEQLKADGDMESLMWLRQNPDHGAAQGVYRVQRAGLSRVLDMAEVPAEDRADFVQRLSMIDNTEDRLRELAKPLAEAQGLTHAEALDVARGTMFVHGMNRWFNENKDDLPERARELLPIIQNAQGAAVADEAEALAPDLSADLPDPPDLGYHPGDSVAVQGRDEPYVGKVLDAKRGDDGRVYLTVDVPVKDADGKVVDSVVRYPDPDDVTKASGKRPTQLKSAKVTGRVREGDQIRIRRKNGDIDLATLDRVLVSKETVFAAEIAYPDGRKERINDAQVQDIRKATSLSVASKAPKKRPRRPKLEGGSRQRKTVPVSGPRGYDPRRYRDARRGLLRKVQALPPGEELELADGSRIRRGDNHGSALIERPDGSTRRYASPARLANAEIAGIERRVGPRMLATDPKDGDPAKHGTLANQQVKDAALDELTKGMPSPRLEDFDDTKYEYWDDLGNLLHDWAENPHDAMERATERQKGTLAHAIAHTEPGSGPFWRGQAVDAGEPTKSGRARGWTRDLEVAIDFAAGGGEIRRAGGDRERATQLSEGALRPGDALLISVYRVEDADHGLDVSEALDRAEKESIDDASARIDQEYDSGVDQAVVGAAGGFLPTTLDTFDTQELQAAFGALPARERDRLKDKMPGAAIQEYARKASRQEVDELMQGIAALTGREDLAERWADVTERAEDSLRSQIEERVWGSRWSFRNPYENEREVILDHEGLVEYQRVNAVIAVGGQKNDLSPAAVRAKIEEAVETGGYKFEDHEPAPGQMTIDDLNEPQYVRQDIDIATGKITTVPLGMASPEHESKTARTLEALDGFDGVQEVETAGPKLVTAWDQDGRNYVTEDLDLDPANFDPDLDLTPADIWLANAEPLDYIERPDFNKDFWNFPSAGTLFHATTPENAEEILRTGLQPRNESRGMTNRHVGGAIFASPNPEYVEGYGDAVVSIDLMRMKEEGFMPEVNQEPAAEEATLKAALAWIVGEEDYDTHMEMDGIDPDTVIFREEIPPRFLGMASPAVTAEATEWARETAPERAESRAERWGGMHSPGRDPFKAGRGKSRKYWEKLAAKPDEYWEKLALKRLPKELHKSEKKMQREDRKLRAEEYAFHRPSHLKSEATNLREKARALAWTKRKRREEYLDWKFSDPYTSPAPRIGLAMASPGWQDGKDSLPNLFDWLKWNKSKPKPRPEEQIERSMLEKPPEPIQGIPDFSHVELTDLKAAGGSNGARIATDEDGLRWLQKTYRGNRDRVATELLANAIYREMGVPVSNAGIGTVHHPQYGETMALTYPLVDGELRHWDEPNEDLGEGFVADALLANWDVVGLDMDNVLWNGDTPIRLDQGGTLEFRAMGATKEFGPVPAELWTMNQGSGQANGRMKITEDSLKAQAADAAIRLSPERIDELVDEAPFSDEKMRERVRDALKARVAWLDRFSRGQESLPRPREGQAEVSSYFAERDSSLDIYPEEEAALSRFMSNEEGLREEVDEHLQLQIPKEEASPEVAAAVKNLDVLLSLDETRLDEEVIAFVPLPAGIDPASIDGKTFTEKSYLPLQADLPEGDSIRVVLTPGLHALHPGTLDPDLDSDSILLGRNTRLHMKVLDGKVTAGATEAPPKYGGFSGKFQGMQSPGLPPTGKKEREEWLASQAEKNLRENDELAEKVVKDIDRRVLTDPIDTLGWHLHPDKQQFTARRADFHKRQLEFMLQGTTQQEEPRAIFMSGGSAAGKGTLLASGQMDMPEDQVRVDADEHKELIPEYQVAKATGDPERAAPMVHEESSYMSKVLSNVAIESQRNVLIDAVGGSKSYFDRIRRARDAGHAVEVNLVTVDPDIAFAQAASRAARTGRSVPVSTIYGSHRNVARTFDEPWEVENSDGERTGEVEEPLTSLGVPVTIWDGHSQQPIARVNSNGAITILDWDAWLKWREIANRPHPAKDPEVQSKIKALAA